MAAKREKPEDCALKYRRIMVLQGQCKSVQEAVRQFGVTVQTYLIDPINPTLAHQCRRGRLTAS